nr:cell wall protein DAN4 isoform X1 [Oryza sativa Japonica Group]XP_025879642.1 cell wall protein DAN4 isoform X1 [Oryza sativa Japonica Group]XP_025879643.1 cell wall protein DAN4 isoform X1 [Oryza sativa Japonica Group]XP_025879644.1 cell wall protein DAN4 isoform X1 [Oryza sativa Japonica Group]XP_025879645.1 cell wall protein DAN4 isoform X1 [Oryza sativa Japonica Group]
MCYKTSKPYGSSYRCSSYSNIGIPDPRYKVVLISGDDDANATFILFGRIAQRLLRRPIESLIEENPPNSEYIPSEITSLIGSNFPWNVSFTRDTVMRSQECLQVNSIISAGASNQPLLLMSPDASQVTSAIVSASSSSSVQTAPTPNETSNESQQPIQPRQTISTPTKFTIAQGTQDTPTSKSSSSTPTKKSIVSVSHMQSSKTKPKTDDKPKTDTKAEENISHDKSSIVVLPDTAENMGKGLPETAEEAKQATPSFPTYTPAKKRGRPTPTATPPVAKKLFKDGAKQKGNDRLLLKHKLTYLHITN